MGHGSMQILYMPILPSVATLWESQMQAQQIKLFR